MAEQKRDYYEVLGVDVYKRQKYRFVLAQESVFGE